jgi:hypothetical protein
MKLDLDIIILGWNSSNKIRDSLNTYRDNGLLDMVGNVILYFQEVSVEDFNLAKEFNLDFIGSSQNVGIGKAFTSASKICKSTYILPLEHDWLLIENLEKTYKILSESIDLIKNGATCVKLRHRKNPGDPLHSESVMWRELESFDNECDCFGHHLLESVHWSDPSIRFPDKVKKEGDWFYTKSCWSNFTNNPCVWNREFYINNIGPFSGNGIDLEGSIAKWWVKQDFVIYQGEGLFTHSK